MARAYSLDLRERVISAVSHDGMSCRAAARHFGIGEAPHGRWHTATFLAALRHDRIDAPWLVDGPINGERFRIYVQDVLVPTLKPGEQVFAKFKHLLRLEAPRTVEAVSAAI